MSTHVINVVVYLTDERGRDIGGAIGCTCGWRADALTHADVALAFTTHRRDLGFVNHDPNRRVGAPTFNRGDSL